MRPVHDPVSTVIFQAGRADVETVMIAGRFVKRGGRLLASGLGRKIEALETSGRRIVSELGIRKAA